MIEHLDILKNCTIKIPSGLNALLICALGSIQREMDMNPGSEFKASQVDVGFAALRIRGKVSEGSGEEFKRRVSRVIEIARKRSLRICYVCGERGRQRTGANFNKVLCNSHFEGFSE